MREIYRKREEIKMPVNHRPLIERMTDLMAKEIHKNKRREPTAEEKRACEKRAIEIAKRYERREGK